MNERHLTKSPVYFAVKIFFDKKCFQFLEYPQSFYLCLYVHSAIGEVSSFARVFPFALLFIIPKCSCVLACMVVTLAALGSSARQPGQILRAAQPGPIGRLLSCPTQLVILPLAVCESKVKERERKKGRAQGKKVRTEHFTVLERQNPSTGELNGVQKRRSADFDFKTFGREADI